MRPITEMAELEGLYDAAVPASLTKVRTRLSPLYRQWIETARFCVVSTVGPEGTDASPRGDDGPVVRIVDDTTLWLPDWRGNNRIDSLRNILRDNRVSLMFMVPGCQNVVRVNGTAFLTADTQARASFERKGRQPATVIVVTVGELYFQCAKALMRSGLWTSGDESGLVPTAGQFLREQDAGFAAEEYDAGYAEYAKPRMW
ncbi:pyridoxamine 5'-phosphate oxidase family protein [Ruegeria sp. WL0004]|uniref:Pyridoxamine 5'-phosphate oxidase family protein n=1 Tax=Ruegeria marisflavi TaxID=2984152 RepID=A0ABT2WVE3_9RHOB|nr:pyridoxamine 5'-phosphate oxidase family protein [Ruegeria sp. WL0004]MCU9839853.1 pyridoxamine 5'-phosphate oxidase family protein [Ruegeria sp. WL0004]